MQLVNERLLQLFFSPHIKKTERMQPIQPEQMERFYDGTDSKSVHLYAVVRHS